MASEAQLEQTEVGRVMKGDGWFVLNAQDARWYSRRAGRHSATSRGDAEFPQLGINVNVLGPGEPMAMYH